MNFQINNKRTIYYCLIIIILFIICFEALYDKKENRSGNELASSENKEFNWNAAKGEKIKVLLNEEQYSESIIKRIADFENKTGIFVDYVVIPEENYSNRVSAMLGDESGNLDVFMTNPYLIWSNAPKDTVLNLQPIIEYENLKIPDYDISDFNAAVLDSFKWDLVPGHKVGTGGQWALPIGFEISALAYNKRVFTARNLQPPQTMDELIELCKKLNEFNGMDTYALAVPRDRSGSRIFTSYITTYANFGAKDFNVVNGKLVSVMNSNQAADMTDTWINMLKTGLSPAWINYKWYQAGADLGVGKAAMLFDTDNNAYYQNLEGHSREAGNIAWTTAPLMNKGEKLQSNLWTWGLAISKYTKHQTASWLFLQYFTSKDFLLLASVNDGLMNPARESVLKNPSFLKKVGSAEGYLETLRKTMNNASVLFTPEPYLSQVCSEWSTSVEDIAAGKYKTTQESLNALKNKIDKMVENLGSK